MSPDVKPETSRPPYESGRLGPGAPLSDRFQVTSVLAADWFGERFLGVDAKTGQAVTILTLAPSLGDEALMAAVRQQVDRAKTVEHKNIATTLAMGTFGELHYVVREHCEGSTLRALLDQKRSRNELFSLKTIYNIVAHICNALMQAHGVMTHGLVSPERVVVSPAGRIKVVDFGLLPLVLSLGQHGTVAPTALEAAYRAPELSQAIDLPGPRADLYSVGLLLYELATGQLPTTSAKPSLARPDLPAALDPLVERCLMRAPEKRFSSADELKHALFRTLEQATAQAVPSAGVAIVHRPLSEPGERVQRGAPVPAPSPVPPRAVPHPVAPQPLPARAPIESVPMQRNGAHGGAASAHDESEERWLVQKNKLDFGPFSLAEIKRQIDRGDIEGEHILVDSDSGKQAMVAQHPLVGKYFNEAFVRREERKRLETAEKRKDKDRRRTVTFVLLTLFALASIGAGIAAYLHFKSQQPIVVVKEVPRPPGESDLERVLKGLNFEFPTPKIRTRKPGKGGKRGGFAGIEDFDDPTHLGDASKEGGEGQLTPQQIQTVLNARGKALALCIAEERRRNPALSQVDLEFIVHGNGQVTAVRVNGQKASPISHCMFNKMKSIPFPKYEGPKTIAGFSWNIK